MIDIREYINDAIKNKPTEHKYANGLDYLFIHEKDGWITIADITYPADCQILIQAADMEHAESYIAMREPITVPVKFL